jgi:exonuclease SbcD
MKLLHFADVHLGMMNFGGLDTATGLHSRVLDYLDALDCVVTAAEMERPDLIIFCGDAFKTRIPNPTLVKHFSERIQKMADVAPVLIIVGNHDRQKGGEGKRHSTEVLRELKAKYPIIVEADISAYEMCGAYVVCVPWQYDVSVIDDVLAIENLMEDAPDELPTILAGHLGIEGASVNSTYAYSLDNPGDFCFDLDALQGFDYMALGHIHQHQALASGIVYSGSLERVNWGERNGPKGFVIANVFPGRRDWKFVDVHARRMVYLDVAWDDIDNLKDADVTDAIVRVRVVVPDDSLMPTVNRKIMDLLPDDYYILDAIGSEPQRTSDRAAAGLTTYNAWSTLELVEEFFDNRYPDDPDYVDVLYNATAELIEEAGDGMDV